MKRDFKHPKNVRLRYGRVRAVKDPARARRKTESQRFLRLEQLADVPKGKVVYHFETVDMARAKKILGETACISGNLSATLLESGTKERVADQVKWAYRHLRAGRRIYF